MSRRSALCPKVIHRRHDAATEQVSPDVVHGDTSSEGVLWINNPASQIQTIRVFTSSCQREQCRRSGGLNDITLRFEITSRQNMSLPAVLCCFRKRHNVGLWKMPFLNRQLSQRLAGVVVTTSQ